MKVSEKKEFVGEFYLPSNPGLKIPGTLNIELNGEVRLETFGNFGLFPQNETQWNIPLINGEVADVGHVTLLNCRYRSLAFGSPSKKTSITALCALCDLDVEYKNKDEIKFTTFRFSVEYLNNWINISGVEINWNDFLNIENPVINIKYVRPESITIELDDKTKLQFVLCGQRSVPNLYEVRISQGAYINLISETPRPLPYFTHLAHKINVFLCLANDNIVCIKDVGAEIKQKIPSGNQPITNIYYRSIFYTQKTPEWNIARTLIQFPIIRQEASAIFNKWIKNYELIRPTYSMYLFCKMEGAVHIEIMFLSLVQALENLHEAGRTLYDEWSNNKVKGLTQKLKNLVFTFENLIPDDQITVWNKIIKNVVDVRNYLTHYNTSEFKEKSENLNFVYFLCEKLNAIIKLHFLKYIGFNNQEIENLLKTRAHLLESEFRRPYQGE